MLRQRNDRAYLPVMLMQRNDRAQVPHSLLQINTDSPIDSHNRTTGKSVLKASTLSLASRNSGKVNIIVEDGPLE